MFWRRHWLQLYGAGAMCADVCLVGHCCHTCPYKQNQRVHVIFHVFALCSRNELGACLVWTFEHFHLSHFPTFLLFYSRSQKLRKLPTFLSSNVFPPAIEYLLLRCVWEQKKVWEQDCSADEKAECQGEGAHSGALDCLAQPEELGGRWLFFFLCVVWVKSIFFLCGSCKECVFLFFCGECVGTAEWDGVIPEVNAISLRHT